MSTAFPPALDVIQGAAHRLGNVVEEISGGRFRIEVFPGGQIMQPFECFDATSKGTIEAFMGSGQHQGDGRKRAEEAHAPFNIVPRPAPGVAPQMFGWFRKKITAIADFKGIKMRMGAHLGGKVIAAASRCRRQCCATSRVWLPESAGNNPRKRPWPGRFMRPSPTIASSRRER
jgi:TRAP-type mannitol/chloroaromatic compound transport system substrate-binding protein